MSHRATAWAFEQQIKPATVKFVLVALADMTDQEGVCFPSIKHLCEMTCLDRKTVIASIDRLEADQVLADTGHRVGKTKQVKVYRLSGMSSVSGTVPEVEQFRSSGQTVPFFPPKEYRKRDTEPARESAIESKRERATRIPDDFELTHERRLVAEAERLPAERVFAKFVNYWRAQPGAKGRKLDWDATWHNWCLNDADRNTYSGRGNGRRDERNSTERAIDELLGR